MGQFCVAVLGAAHRQYFVKQSLEQYWYNTWGTVLVSTGGNAGAVLGTALRQYWESTGRSTGGDSIEESSWFSVSCYQCILTCLPESAIV